MAVKRRLLAPAMLCLIFACSRLQPLTVDVLTQAEAKWKAQRPESYRLVVEMSAEEASELGDALKAAGN